LEEAMRGGGRAQWGREVPDSQFLPAKQHLLNTQGFYFAVASEIRWKDAAEAINRLGIEQGWLPAGTKTVSYTADQVGSTMPKMPGLARYIWGSNSRAISARAMRLGWEPKGPSFWDELAADVAHAVENKQSRLGRTK
jgi:hypothetical protein